MRVSAAALVLGAALVLVAALVPTIAPADNPPPEYFTGVYERVGRDADGNMINDVVRIDPAEGGLALRKCGAGAAQVPEVFAFDSYDELTNLLTSDRQWCLYFNNGDNYPLMNCAGVGAERATLWPEPDVPCLP